MTNVIFSPTLQAPIAISNPAGALSCTRDPGTAVHQANPIPTQGSVSFSGVAVRLSFSMATLQGASSVTGATPTVVSGVVTPRVPSTGAVGLAGAAPALTNGSGVVLTFPRIMLCGVGGDQSYGSNSTTGYPAWTTAAAGSAAYTAIQTLGCYDIAIIQGVFEGWDTGNLRDRENLTQALLKNATYSVTKSPTRPTLAFYYEMMIGTIAGNPYAQWQTLVDANNWYLYETAGGTGTKTPFPFGTGQSFINFSVAWPTSVGSAPLGASICGSNYGTTSSGSPTGLQGPARAFGNYASIKLLMKGYTGDSRFSFNAGMGSPSAAGIFLDNCFAALDGAGSVPDSSLDGITISSGSQQGGGFPGLDTPQPLLARGNHNMFDQMQTMLSLVNPGKTYYNFANFGQFANKYQFGVSTLTAGLENTLHGGLLENAIGAGASSWEYFQRGNFSSPSTPYLSGWPNVLANYYQGMDFCQAPKLVGLGTKLPATDGSQTASWVIGGGTTLATVSTGTALEYQLMRYALCTTLLDDGYFAPGVSGYDWSKLRWYDEYGDDSLAQVNVRRGYLGTPLTVRPSSPTWAQGALGVWSRSFTNGMAIVNPRGNGAQTVALPASYTKLTGTQQSTINNGATVSSVALADGDGIILLGPVGLPDLSWSATAPIRNGKLGYAALDIWYGDSTSGRQGGYIYPVFGAGPIDLYLKRVRGTDGILSVTVALFATVTTTSGTHFAPASATVTWADGEIGRKRVSFNIKAIPQGFGLIGVSMTGSAFRPNAWIHLVGTGYVPNAKFFKSSNAVNVAGNTAGSGTQASPYLGLANALTQTVAATTPRVLYWQQNGTAGHMEWTAGTNGGTAGNPGSLGVNVSGMNASLTNPLILLPDPANTAVATFDQGVTGTDPVKYSNAFGINFAGNSSYIWICGIRFVHCNINNNPGINGGNGTNNVVYQCQINNFSQHGSNAAGVRFDNQATPIIQDVYLNGIYSDESGRVTNPFTATASGLEEGIQMFNTPAASIAHCHGTVVQFVAMNKQSNPSGAITGPGWDVKNCYGDLLSQGSTNSGALVHMPVQGANWTDGILRDSVCDATASPVIVNNLIGNEPNTTTAVGFDIDSCVQINTLGLLGSWHGVTDTRMWNCISQGGQNPDILLGPSSGAVRSTLTYCDHNEYVGTTHTFETGYNTEVRNYATVTAWQGSTAAGDPYVTNAPDVNSIVTTTIPSWPNQAGRDYRISNTLGLGGQPIGVGLARVGCVNNFLNSSLPKAPS
jgi:hypothetical protein